METKIKEDVRNKLSGITTVISLIEMLRDDDQLSDEQRVKLQKILVDSRKVARTALEYLVDLIGGNYDISLCLNQVRALLDALDILDRDDITDDFRFVMYAKRNGCLLKAHMAVNLILRHIDD